MEWDFQRLSLFLLVPFPSADGHLRRPFGRGRTRGRALALGARRDRPWARLRRWLLGGRKLSLEDRMDRVLGRHPRVAVGVPFLMDRLWDHTPRSGAHTHRQ